MAVESDADLAAFFNADDFGVAADYLAPGADDTVPCVVLKNFSDRSLEGEFGGKPITVGRTLTVLDTQVTPLKGGTFTIASVDYTVQGDPRSSDADRKIWVCTVARDSYSPSLNFSDARNSQYIGQVV